MESRRISDEERQFFDENGYLIVRGALQGEKLRRVVEAADGLVSARYRETGSRRASLSNVVALEESFIPLLTLETTVPLVVQLLSFNIRLTKSHLIYKYPDPEDVEEPTFWHRDIRNSAEDLGPAANTRMQIKVAYHLSDAMAPGCGNTWLVPGSNKYTQPLEIPEGAGDPANALEPQLRAGDAFLFENRTYHRQGLNRTQMTRKVLMFGYSYAWLSPNDFEVQAEEVLDRIHDPIARQLMGAARSPNSQIDYRPLREWAEQHGVRRASEIGCEQLTG
jgi:ectoine hydroxylase